jgi:hypothetical protein
MQKILMDIKLEGSDQPRTISQAHGPLKSAPLKIYRFRLLSTFTFWRLFMQDGQFG